MPIQRASEREQRPSALDVFTDREQLIAAFERNLEHKKPEEHRVLVFYGDGAGVPCSGVIPPAAPLRFSRGGVLTLGGGS
jgi:hypothetical protein